AEAKRRPVRGVGVPRKEDVHRLPVVPLAERLEQGRVVGGGYRLGIHGFDGLCPHTTREFPPNRRNGAKKRPGPRKKGGGGPKPEGREVPHRREGSRKKAPASGFVSVAPTKSPRTLRSRAELP